MDTKFLELLHVVGSPEDSIGKPYQYEVRVRATGETVFLRNQDRTELEFDEATQRHKVVREDWQISRDGAKSWYGNFATAEETARALVEELALSS